MSGAEHSPDVGGAVRRAGPARVLVLGGTGEARALAAALVGRVHVVSSLAGRLREPQLPPGEVRVGGFGGAAALGDYLRAERIDAVVDATHPFADRITRHAVDAAAGTRLPVLVLRRPGWTAVDGDRWHRVPSLDAAAGRLDRIGATRVLLTTCRRGLEAFAGNRQWFLVRSVDPPDGDLPPHAVVHRARGPFDLDGERRLLARHAIDAVVTKDSGGTATAAKLVAARERGIPVVVVDRPPLPPGAGTVGTVEDAVRWLDDVTRMRP